MASGQQKAQQNLLAFQTWASTQSDDDFRQIIHRGQLNRGEIAKATGFAKSALRQNPAIKEALDKLESDLRERGVLPPETGEKDDAPKLYDHEAPRRMRDAQKNSQLEREVIELRARVAQLEAQLECHSEQAESMVELELFPR